MRALALWTLFVLAFRTPLSAQPATPIDKGQAQAALRLMSEGDTVRFYCKPCADVVYTATTVRSKELRTTVGRLELVLNGEAVDVAQVYVDDGYGEGWKNLASLLGILVEGPTPKLSIALDDVTRLAPHAGSYAGLLGGAKVHLDLVLDGRKLHGSYAHDDGGASFKLVASIYNATRSRESLTLIERGAGDRLTATLEGTLDSATGTFKGARKPLGGSPEQPFELHRRAENED